MGGHALVADDEHWVVEPAVGVHFVEWGEEKLEKILKEYGFDILVVNIEKKEESREYTIES